MRILNFQRMSTEDGPGLRTTLFVKGCPLKCAWCHNPESISPQSHIEWNGAHCIGCRSCVGVCPTGAVIPGADGIVIDKKKCTLCFRCVDECPALALERKGLEMSVDEAFAELIKDRAYFGTEGGVTLSGGEITMQYAETEKLLKKLSDAGIHTAIDTCGLCKREALETLLPYTDLVLYDLKLADSAQHRRWTGADNAVILENFEYLCALRASGAADFGLWVRTPIIPGASDSVENVAAIAKIVGSRADRWELCAFNNLCRSKYERLGADWLFRASPLMTRGEMEQLTAAARAAGAENVCWTGRTAMEETI